MSTNNHDYQVEEFSKQVLPDSSSICNILFSTSELKAEYE